VVADRLRERIAAPVVDKFRLHRRVAHAR
jgi:hypothetical protein